MAKKLNAKISAKVTPKAMVPLTHEEQKVEKVVGQVLKAKMPTEMPEPCVICVSKHTAKRMSGKLRMHETSEGLLCHACYNKSRRALA